MQTPAPSSDSIVFFRNQFVPLADANVNILTHGLNYGTGVFEGIRGYYDERSQDLMLYRAVEHYERWRKNCGILRISVPRTASELTEITAEICRRNNFRCNVYVRPIAYKAAERIGVHPDDNDAFCVTVVPFGSHFDNENGARAGVVSWRRLGDNAIPGRAKICGAYVNSVLASDEARRNGHDEAILLTEDGHVAEGATCNIFILRGRQLITPPPTDNILEGITRSSVMELARNELNLQVVERSIARTELYVCDEAFFTGTAVEIAPIISIDHRPVGRGEAGVITQKLRALYFDATRGGHPGYRHWLQPVYHPEQLRKTA